ncbi:MAG TPA: gas vesicle protein GvpJ [Candidatus Angelobacter sp.]|nr:gas vesicle protein GvpJ [Candidatus Angelobacter sp.]
MYRSLRINSEDRSTLDFFDRILDKGIVFDPWARIAIVGIDFCHSPNRIVVAPERRRLPFIVPVRGKSAP